MKKNELAYEFDPVLTALSKMDSKERIFEFMLDLLTEKEILEFSRRFEVAKMLDDGISYARIEKKTGMSSTTIARISKALNSENMGYRNALNIVLGV
ncbi:MAG: YerC/YecD family TrpR-related protein [Candidatus Gracilibacteria bacterium]|nr:YerC/YecD family TrpR-related protein [Candidatus Gracilibacteria bacterium]